MNRQVKVPQSAGQAAAHLHLFALWGFAVAQPLLDLLGRHPHFFVVHDARPSEIVAYAIALCGLPPALVGAFARLAQRIAPEAGRLLHALMGACLTAAIFLQLFKSFEFLPGVVWVLLALALGFATALLYERAAGFRAFLTWLSPAPLVFVIAFLFFSPAKKVVRPEPLTSREPIEIEAEIPVVLAVFDELSLPTLMDTTYDIDAERYPNFAALRATSHWFRNATTTAESTIFALPAILTGRYLDEDSGRHRLATATIYPNSLFTLLGDAYSLNVFETRTRLCPWQLCPSSELDASAGLRLRRLLTDSAVVYPHTLLPADLTARLPSITNQWGHFEAFANKHNKRAAWKEIGRRPQIFASFLQTICATPSGDRPTVHFLHSTLPHFPWSFLPSGARYDSADRADGLEKGLWSEDPWPVLQTFQRYLLQLAYVDRLLGNLLTTLEETGLLDSALLIVTADHGTSFKPGGARRIVRGENFADVMSVPLFIKLPHQLEGVVSDRNVELIDVLPTVADILGIEIPWSIDGVSVFDTRRPERTEKRIFPSANLGHHLVFESADLEAKYRTVDRMAELFGSRSDPLALFRIGAYGDLVGRPLSELEVGGEARAEVRLTVSELYDRVDLAGVLPARVRGEARSPILSTEPLHLAVVLNGTVQATTRTLKARDGRARFTAMVPEIAFVSGHNTIEIFVISGSTRKPRLTPTKAWG